MQTWTGARDKLKGYIAENKNHSKAGKKQKLNNQKMPWRTNKTKLCKTHKKKHGNEDYENDSGGDGEDLTKT